MNTIERAYGSTDGNTAFRTAERMAVKGHKSWIVWQLTDGTFCFAKLSLDSLETARAECALDGKKPCVWRNMANDRMAIRASAWMIDFWIRDIKAGTFDFN